jgi:hypothetical protein
MIQIISITIFCIYILPTIISYFLVRSLIIHENAKPDTQDVLMVIFPIFNILTILLIIIFNIGDWFKSRFSAKKFFRIK